MSLVIRLAFVVGATAVIVRWLPGFLQSEPPVVVNGFVAKGFEGVKTAFRENFENGRDNRRGGSAFAAYHRGKLVVDLWGGYADIESNQEWRRDTMTMFFSTTKGIAAICIAMLVDRGFLDYDQPVAHYWPEFAQKGKEKITVREMMEHKAGLVLAAEPGLSFEIFRDVARAGELMASSEPVWELDGTTHGYHSITFGPLVNELLRRVDPLHRTMGKFIEEELAKPLGLDLYLGLPFEENYRTARLIARSDSVLIHTLRGVTNSANRQLVWHIITDESKLFQRSIDNAGMKETGEFNNPYTRRVEIASANGIGTARSVAQLYGILAEGGTDRRSNKTILSREILSKLFKAGTPSIDRTLGVPIDFKFGFMANDVLAGEMMFGTPGAGGQLGYADPRHELGFSFLSTHMSPFFLQGDPRTETLLTALYKATKSVKRD